MQRLPVMLCVRPGKRQFPVSSQEFDADNLEPIKGADHENIFLRNTNLQRRRNHQVSSTCLRWSRKREGESLGSDYPALSRKSKNPTAG
jgi:hypothetical protein